MKTVFIIGAGRSGTNLLRDLICMHPKIKTWPCDEINYIFRYRKLIKTFYSDRLESNDMDTKTQSYLKKQFLKLKGEVIIEKTCANSLRVSYLHKNFPDAKFIFIHRNGKDVVISAMKRWKGKVKSKYISSKLRLMPWQNLWFHIPFQIFNKLHKIIFGNYFRWGPHTPLIKKEKKLIDKCVIQWKECVEKTMEDLNLIDQNQFISLDFDFLINNVDSSIEKCLNFIGVSSKDFPKESLNNLIDPGVLSRSEVKDEIFNLKQLEILKKTEDKIICFNKLK